jgi:RNA polymerase sigma-70 factor (ECF subfamily)
MSGSYDEQLARRLQARDPGAMTELYDRYGKLVWSLIVAIVRNAADAEDLTEETFLRVWNRVHAFDAGRGAIGPWLLAMARNLAIARLRSRNARMDRGAADVDIREHPSLFVDMDREVLNADHPKAMRSAMAKLSPDQRKTFELAYYEGLSQDQIAERLGEPPEAVKTWLREATKQLREELGQAVAA